MATDPVGAARRFLARIFPERQIYHRSVGQVHFVTVSPAAQILFISGALLFLSWVAFTTVNTIFKGQIINERDREYRTMVQTYEERLSVLQADIDNLHGALAVVRESFEQELDDLRGRQGQIDSLIEQQSSFLDQHGKLRNKVAMMGNDPRSAAEHKSAVLMDVIDREPVKRQSRKVASGQVNSQIDGVVGMLATIAESRDNIRLPLTRDTAQVFGLKQKATALRKLQQATVQELEEEALHKITELEAIVARTRLDTDKLVTRFAPPKKDGLGGPMIALTAGTNLLGNGSDAFAPRPFDRQLIRIRDKIDRLTALSRALDHLPIIRPLDRYRITSNFGPRRDPYTRRAAFHPGLDLGAPSGTPVLATAPGVVSFSGRRGAYGLMVEIQHGNGIKTRYGHLRRLLVKNKQRVTFRQAVGQVGSTGRSTGPHLHYEVWFDGRPRDPMHFLEAGRYVYKS